VDAVRDLVHGPVAADDDEEVGASERRSVREGSEVSRALGEECVAL